MTMKIKSIALCLVLILVMSSFSVSAVSVFENITIDYSRETGMVNIEGTLAAGVSDRTARLMVLKPDADIEKLIDGTLSFKECGIHASEAAVEENSFEFAPFKIDETYEAGDYIIRIAAGNYVYTEILSVASVNQAFELAVNAADAGELGDYIEKYNDVYQLDTGAESLYGGFDEEGKLHVLSQLCDREYEGLEDFQEEFNRQTVFYKIYVGPWGTLEEVISSNTDILSVSMTDFNNLTSTKQDEVCKALCGNFYYDAASFKSAFEAEIVKAEENQSSGKTDTSSSRGSRGGSTTYYSEIEKPAASMEPTAEPAVEVFSDLDNHEWARSSIELLKEKGIVNGRGDGTFAPDSYVTRSEAVKMVVLALGEVDESATCNFADVSMDSWAYPYIATATEAGVIYGYDNGSFGADDNITREDLAVIVMRAAMYYNISIDEIADEVSFADSESISSYAKDAVKLLQKADIINGMNGYFQPKAFATRAQTAKIIASIIS